MVIETVNDPLARALRALADPNRRRLVEQLRSHEECVSVLAERLGLSTALVSHHLRLLVGAGFVHERRSGSWRCYSLVPEYLDWLQGALDELLDPNLPAEAACCTKACGERQVTPPASNGRRRAAAH
ncbi:MAG: metalloregulator ArsR/SmtB family transcription factor [Actinomycetota bacterium]|nr:metalloregulator ArsR/SmtB family transcription factor [Actinomycetota bacterium]